MRKSIINRLIVFLVIAAIVNVGCDFLRNIPFIKNWGHDFCDLQILYGFISVCYFSIRKKLASRLLLFFSSSSVGIATEFLQYWHVLAGTFDWFDIATFLIAGIIAVILDTVFIRAK